MFVFWLICGIVILPPVIAADERITVSFEASPTQATVNQPISIDISATVTDRENVTIETTVTVVLIADGTETERITRNVTDGTTEQVIFEHTFSEPGTYTVTVRGTTSYGGKTYEDARSLDINVESKPTPTSTPEPGNNDDDNGGGTTGDDSQSTSTGSDSTSPTPSESTEKTQETPPPQSKSETDLPSSGTSESRSGGESQTATSTRSTSVPQGRSPSSPSGESEASIDETNGVHSGGTGGNRPAIPEDAFTDVEYTLPNFPARLALPSSATLLLIIAVLLRSLGNERSQVSDRG